MTLRGCRGTARSGGARYCKDMRLGIFLVWIKCVLYTFGSAIL